MVSDEVKQNYELAENDYITGMKYKEIAEKYGVTINTVKSWKTRYGWNRNKKGVHTKSEKVCTQKGGQPGNKNALGNNGGAPEQNKNAEKHGLFAKYLPEETLDIVNNMTLNPLDILWDNIQIAYAAIVRAQHIMYVRDITDKTTEKVEVKVGKTMGEKWEVQQAWDKQANFLKSQARAQGELRSLIKQYDEMLHKNWELASEEQRSRIDHMKAQTDKLTGNNAEIEDMDEIEGDIYGSGS